MRLPSAPSAALVRLIPAACLVAAVPCLGALPVEIEAPKDVKSLLERNLDLAGAPAGAAASDRLALIRRARRQINELLATEGYFKPAIDVLPGTSGPPVLKIVPGARATIADVSIEFSGDIASGGGDKAARTEAMKRNWLLKPGQPFRQASWNLAKEALLQQLQEKDYPAASISESLADVDAENARVHLKIVANSGPAFTLGPLSITGLKTYSPELVQRYNTLRPGEPYSQDRLLALQAALQNSPYFSSVLVDIGVDPAHPRDVPVRVSLSEATPKKLRVGAGYSTNTGARSELAYSNADFLGRAWNLNSALRAEQLHQILFADIFLPPADRDYRISLGSLAEHSNIQGLEDRRVAVGAVRAQVRGGIETKLALNFQRERIQIGGLAPTQTKALTLDWSWTRRDVDDILDPRRGSDVNFDVGGGARAALSDQNFVRTYLHSQIYFPVGARDVFSLREEAGVTAAPSRDGIPQNFLFRAGGTQSIRGYAWQSLGPVEAGAVVGGRYLLLGSAEYVHWLENSKWGVAAFADGGNATDNWQDYKAVWGYGLGARWKSPAGPLGLDFAWSARDRKLRLHFALAVAF